MYGGESFTSTTPYTLSDGKVRGLAGVLAGKIISDTRTLHGPVCWLTGNAYMPPLRSFPEAEEVWNAENNDDGELFEFFASELHDHLDRAFVALECPEYDNSLYSVDLKRWQYKDTDQAFDDLNDEWEPVDTLAVDDNAENPRE